MCFVLTCQEPGQARHPAGIRRLWAPRLLDELAAGLMAVPAAPPWIAETTALTPRTANGIGSRSRSRA